MILCIENRKATLSRAKMYFNENGSVTAFTDRYYEGKAKMSIDETSDSFLLENSFRKIKYISWLITKIFFNKILYRLNVSSRLVYLRRIIFRIPIKKTTHDNIRMMYNQFQSIGAMLYQF